MKRARDDLPSPRADFVMQDVSVSVREQVRKHVVALVFGGAAQGGKYSGEKSELPGPQPVNLSRRHLELLEREDFGVCEKSDGERFMLLLVHGAGGGGGGGGGAPPPGAYMVSRRFEVSTLRGGEAYTAAMAAHGPTLLDGELLRRTTDMGSGTGALAVYMVFDCVCADGVDVAGRPLKVRMEELNTRVREPFRALDDGRRAEGAPGLPLYLLAKNIVGKAGVRGLLDKIVTSAAATGGSHGSSSSSSSSGLAPLESETIASAATVHRLYRDGKRVNPTDGLIFTPAAASYRDLFQRPGGEEPPLPLIKWKFLDDCTTDYFLSAKSLERACRAGSGGSGGGGASSSSSSSSGARGAEALQWVPLSLRCMGGYMEIARCRLSVEQARGYLAILERVPGDGENLVVECAFDKESSAWAIRRVRDNKNDCNALRTGWSTLESLVEDVREEELVRRLKKPSSGGGAGGAASGSGGPEATS